MPIQPLPIPLPTNATINFNLLGSIGSGGEGEVFIAFDSQLNADIAIKRIPVAAFQNITQYFAESQKLYLTRHHNVVKILYGGQDNDYIYLAMPYYAKGSIKDLLNSRFLTCREIIRYSLQFLSGLNNVHSKGLLHFDIKCENLLLSEKDQALLSDFGLAEYTSQYGFSTISGTTPIYAPPEFFAQTQHNIAFDVYQAGLSMYRMSVGDYSLEDDLTRYNDAQGNLNFPRFAAALSAGTFPSRVYPLHIPRALKAIINKALEPNPANRYNSVIDILNDLSAIDAAHDWVYTIDAAGNEKWVLDNTFIEATKDNQNWNILAKKNNRRVTNYCVQGVSNHNKNTLVYRGLMSGL